MAGVPRIMVLGTGGTIAGKGASSLDLTRYEVADVPLEGLLRPFSELNTVMELATEQIFNLPSSELTLEDLRHLALRVRDLLEQPDVDGVVITHGTDTLEETAYFLNLTLPVTKPVVLTGAMRPATAVGADGLLNLVQALCVAASPEAAGQGVLVVLNSEINTAADVIKMNTSRPEAFMSPDYGALGLVEDLRPVFFREVRRLHTYRSLFDIRDLRILPKVGILMGYLDAGPEAAEGLIAGGAQGIVVACVGNGNINRPLFQVLKEAVAQGIVVVRASRCISGNVSAKVRFDEEQFIASGALNPQKARILLTLALTKTASPGEIQALFHEY